MGTDWTLAGKGHNVWVPTDYQDMTMVYEGIYNTSMKAKTLKLFQLADDEIEDHPFIPIHWITNHSCYFGF